MAYGLMADAVPHRVITRPDGTVRMERDDAAGRLAVVAENLGSTVTFGYNAVGDLLSVLQGNQLQLQNTYDLAGRKIGSDDADLGAWASQYDAKNRLVAQTNAKGQQTTFAYDALGRLPTRTTHRVGGSTIATPGGGAADY